MKPNNKNGVKRQDILIDGFMVSFFTHGISIKINNKADIKK